MQKPYFLYSSQMGSLSRSFLCKNSHLSPRTHELRSQYLQTMARKCCGGTGLFQSRPAARDEDMRGREGADSTPWIPPEGDWPSLRLARAPLRGKRPWAVHTEGVLRGCKGRVHAESILRDRKRRQPQEMDPAARLGPPTHRRARDPARGRPSALPSPSHGGEIRK